MKPRSAWLASCISSENRWVASCISSRKSSERRPTLKGEAPECAKECVRFAAGPLRGPHLGSDAHHPANLGFNVGAKCGHWSIAPAHSHPSRLALAPSWYRPCSRVAQKRMPSAGSPAHRNCPVRPGYVEERGHMSGQHLRYETIRNLEGKSQPCRCGQPQIHIRAAW